MLNGVAMVNAVLAAKTRYALLSLGSDDGPILVDKEGYLNKEDEEVRRCYTRIAARVHPDKLTGCPDATRAFQALVRAYELCCKPDVRGDESDDSRDDEEDDDNSDDSSVNEEEEAMAPERAAPPKLSSAKGSAKKAVDKAAKKNASKRKASSKARAKPTPPEDNAQECRTGVRCPRCHTEWGAHLKSEGREALYTSFMRGQRQVQTPWPLLSLHFAPRDWAI
jgi:curved DNA-binding protein CbpA